MPDPIFIDPTNAPAAGPVAAPQMTPMQQQFLSQLGAQPGSSYVYQPAQTFDSPEYQKSLYEWEQQVRQQAETARADQAVQAGIRYIYQQRYDADLKKGIPEPQAFSKMMLGIAMHTPKSDPVKMFQTFQQPHLVTLPGVGPVVTGPKVQFPPPKIPTGPVATEPLIGTDGQPIPGFRAARGTSGALHVIKETPTEAKASPSLNFQMLKADIASTEKALADLDKTDLEYAPLAEKLKGLKAELDTMRHPKEAQPSTPKAPSTNEVTRLTKDGRKAIFDATTKQFIRYAD